MNKIFYFFIIALVMASATLHATPPICEQTFPDGLINAIGESYNVNKLNEKQLVGLYFSAGWCRGCRAFTPKLIPFRNDNKEIFEVVLVNFDKSKQDMMAYMLDYPMPWPAIPFGTSSIQVLKEKFKITEIPALIVMTTEGKVITQNGYDEVDLAPSTCIEHWLKLSKKQN